MRIRERTACFLPAFAYFSRIPIAASEIAASAVRTTTPRPHGRDTHENIGPGARAAVYISRPDEKRPESDRLIYDLGTGLPALTIANCFSHRGGAFLPSPRLASSRLASSRLAPSPVSLPPPQNFRNFPRSIVNSTL